jgi:hypothetical protein
MRAARPSVPVVVLLLAVANGSANAAAMDAKIPAPLRPWAAWVLDGEEGKNARCPAHVGDDDPVCAWPARLVLDLADRGGSFSQAWTLFRSAFVALPGDKEHWPGQIKLDGKQGTVVDHDGEPELLLPVGHHTVTGAFAWDSLPESLLVPSRTGLVALTLNGAPVRFPMRENDGRLFLGKKAPDKVEEDRVDLSVYRKLTDAAPLMLTTHLVLAVSGKSRELVLSRVLPAGFEPRAVESVLPLRFESDGRARLQARPGQWTIDIQAHRVSFEKSVTRPAVSGLWKEGDEVWVFEQVPELRTASVEGVPTIDPAQTLMPNAWKSFPTYAMAPGATLTLVEQKRGDAEPAPERLSLDRTLWLDGDGGAFSVHDVVAGEFTRAWRLEVDEETRLGRLAVDSKDQFLTRLGSAGRTGVEIRSGRAIIDADSRITNQAGSLPATSFVHDFDKLSATLNLPVGWDLLHASGADQITGSWVERWTLSSLLLLLVLVLGLARLYGLRVGLLALGAFGSTLIDPEAPAAIWLAAIAGEVLIRALRPSPVRVAAQVARLAVWVILALTTIPFVVTEARFALHPANATDRVEPSRFVAFLSQATTERTRSAEPTSGAPQPIGSLVEEGDLGMENLKAQKVSGLKGGGKLAGRRHKGEEGKVAALGLRAPSNPQAPPADAAGAGILGNLNTGYALNAAEYDPSIVVQTGEGLPRQTWRSATFAFNGPVKSDRRLRLYLLPPWLGRIWAFAKVVLLVWLAWLMVRRPLRLRGALIAPTPLLAGLLTLVLLVPLSARAAEFPPQDMLDALKQRLLEKPDCAPNCAALNDMNVEVLPALLKFTLHASTAMPGAIALPGDNASWSPTDVRVDGKVATTLERSATGQLWLALGTGVFTIQLSGPLPSRDSIQIPLSMRPRRATFKAHGFELSGIHEDGAVDESIVLARIASAAAGTDDGKSDLSSEAAPTLPPFLRVERTLGLGLKWEVHTRVMRETPTGTPVVIEIPLLHGESVTTANIRSEKSRGTVSLNLGAGDNEVSWQSTLAQSSSIHLRTDPASASHWSEVWRAEVAPIWHATFTGIPPIRQASGGATRIPEWRPWPGEEVHISVEKPSGAAGQTLTIDASTLAIEPGVHSTQATLALDLRSSRSTTHAIVLPPGAEEPMVLRDNVTQVIRRDRQELILDVLPGKHNVSITWRQPLGLSTLFRVPAVDVRLPSTNSNVTIRRFEKPRWILWLAGPSLGPVVGFWALAVVLLFASIALTRTRLTPLRAHHWLLLWLGLALAQSDWVPMLVVPVCLLALGWRARREPNQARPMLYNVGQVVLGLLLVGALAVVANAVDFGLWRIPDMGISGNHATGGQLIWYQDRAGQVLAQPTVVSLPISMYRLLVVGWTLWLGFSAIRWASWVWTCLHGHGLWRALAKPTSSPPPGL